MERDSPKKNIEWIRFNPIRLYRLDCETMWMMIVNLMINGLAWFAMYWCVLCTLSLSAFALCIRFAFAMHGIDVPSVLGIFVGKLCTYTHGWTAWPERCQVCGIAGELKCFGVSQLSCSNMSTTYCLNKMINNHNRKWKGTAKSKHSPNNPQLAVSVTSLSNLYIYLYIYIHKIQHQHTEKALLACIIHLDRRYAWPNAWSFCSAVLWARVEDQTKINMETMQDRPSPKINFTAFFVGVN